MQDTPTKKKKLGFDDYEIKGKLGRGAYGQVFEVARKDNPKRYALKQIQKKQLAKEQKQYQAFVERELLTRIDHPGVIKIIASFQDVGNLYFCLELCEGGEFKHFLQLAQGKFNQEAFKFYAAQIVNTLEYLHKHGIVHRDLKPENIMVSAQGHLKLIDFGTAEFSNSDLVPATFKERIEEQKKALEKAQDNDQPETNEEQEKTDSGSTSLKIERRSTFVGTSYYISPELLEENISGPPSDLWAFGCCLYQFYYGKTPFSDFQEFMVFERIKALDYHFPALPSGDSIPQDAKDLISKLLVKQPLQRLGANDYTQLKTHKFFKGIDVDRIFQQQPPDLSPMSQDYNYKKQATPKSPNSKQCDLILQKEWDIKSPNPKSLSSSFGSPKSSEGHYNNGDCGQFLLQGMVEKRKFLIYTDTHMTLLNSGSIMMSKAQKPDKKKVFHLEKGNPSPAQLLEPNKFSLQTATRKYIIKSEIAETWVKQINQRARAVGEAP